MDIGQLAGRRRHRRQGVPVTAVLIFVILSVAAARPAHTAPGVVAPGPRSAPVTPIADPIEIDGMLDEPARRPAPPIGERRF